MDAVEFDGKDSLIFRNVFLADRFSVEWVLRYCFGVMLYFASSFRLKKANYLTPHLERMEIEESQRVADDNPGRIAYYHGLPIDNRLADSFAHSLEISGNNSDAILQYFFDCGVVI